MKSYITRLGGAAAVFCVMLFFLTGCTRKIEPITRTDFLLNTYVTVTLYDNDDPGILNGCLDLCRSYENLFSKTIEGSELYRINHRPEDAQTLSISQDMERLLEKGLYYSELSGGRFDITVEPLSSLWDFAGDSPGVPPAEEIGAARGRVGYQNVRLDEGYVTFASPDTTVDLGAIAKGYIADRMKEYLLANGVNSAIINLGGNVLCVGSRPDGKPFRIGVKKPYADHSETVFDLSVQDRSVVSSGVYERYFVQDGKEYHHILNPEDGYPYENGLVSVTIISDLSVDGDALSTVCFSLGLEEGMALINSLNGVEGIFITDAYEIVYSDGAV